MKKYVLMITFVGLALLLCQCKTPKVNERMQNQLDNPYSLNVLLPLNVQYFPEDAFTNSDGSIDTITGKYYSKILEDMRCFRYGTGFKDWERYRLLISIPERDFIVIETERQMLDYSISWRTLSRDTTGGSRKVIKYETMAMKDDEWEKMSKLIQKAKTWEMPTVLFTKDEMKKMAKPAKEEVWLFEADNQGKHYVVKRSNPDKKTPYRNLCEYLLTLTDIEI
jgi:hypothetical protein